MDNSKPQRNKRTKLSPTHPPDHPIEPSSEDESDHGAGSDSSYEDSEEEIDFIKNLNQDKNGRVQSRNHVTLTDSEDGSREENDGLPRSEKTQKRKRRAKSPTSFGIMLSQALKASEKSSATGPSTTLHPTSRLANRIAKQQAASEAQRKQSAATRHELQERGHIRDIIGGWTPRPAVPFSEWLIQGPQKWRDEGAYIGGASQEKALRRLAQTGVVKLFNAIRAAQNVDEEDAKASLPTLSGAQKRKLNKLVGSKIGKKDSQVDDTVNPTEVPEAENAVGRFKPNILGSRGKDEALANLSKATFLELIKTGGKPS